MGKIQGRIPPTTTCVNRNIASLTFDRTIRCHTSVLLFIKSRDD